MPVFHVEIFTSTKEWLPIYAWICSIGAIFSKGTLLQIRTFFFSYEL